MRDKICYRVFEAKETKQILVCVHGFAGDKESSVIEALGLSLKNEGVTTVAFDLPCHGEDENKDFSVKLCINYLKDTLKQIKAKSSAKISVFATSFGAFVLLHYLSKSRFKFDKIILRSPAIDMEKIIYKIIKLHGFSLEDINTKNLNLGFNRELIINKEFINTLKLPKFPLNNDIYLNIIQGKKDELIDCDFNEQYFNKYFLNRHKIFYFENADHRYKKPGEKEEIVEITKGIIL